jgi:hypothetical protein
VVPAQFGVDVLSFEEAELDHYMVNKRKWNYRAIESGVPYTIVSQGAFSEWMVQMCPFIHHDTRYEAEEEQEEQEREQEEEEMK